MTDPLDALTANTKYLSAFEGKAHAIVSGMVSVVVPNFNKGAYLKECLESILDQTYDNIEIVFIDDCSTDTSSDLVSHLLLNSHKAKERAARGRLKTTILTLPRRVGVAWAQNIGYYLASGEFLANQDSDDVAMPKRIERQVRYLKDHPKISAVGTDYHQFTGPASMAEIAAARANSCRTPWLAFDVDEVRKAYEAHMHRVCWGTLMMRSSVINLLGGNTKKCLGAEDFECILRMIQAGLSVANIPEKLYLYRKNSTQRSTLFHGVRRE